MTYHIMQMDPDDVMMPTEAQLHKWAQANLKDSRFMHLPADMLRVLIHHVHSATLHAHALLPREIAKEKLFKMEESQHIVRERKCANECGNVQYDYNSDDELNDAGVRYCEQCERDICHDCGIEFCDICCKVLCHKCMKTEDWRVCDTCGQLYCAECECTHSDI